MTAGLDPSTCTPPLRRTESGDWDLEVRLQELPRPLDVDALFGRSAPLEIEVGFGSGIFLAHEAARRPEVNFLGVEKDPKQVRRAKHKWQRRGLLNTRAIRSDAFYFLEEYIADRSVKSMHVLFSDPWFKNRHLKRRVFRPALLPILERILLPGALLHVKTDISDYYTIIRRLLDEAPFLERLVDRRLDLDPDPDDIVTNYQRKALEKGHPVHLLLYKRRP